jgi:hypothetical protein
LKDGVYRTDTLIRKNDTQGTHKRNSLRTAIATVAAAHPSQLAIVFSLSNSSKPALSGQAF